MDKNAKGPFKMRIIDLLKLDTPSISFEVFPPKTESNFDSVKEATDEIVFDLEENGTALFRVT